MKSKIVLIAGGSGMVGTQLTELLLEHGYEVRYLSRRKIHRKNVTAFLWNPFYGTLDENAFTGVNHIVNLAGENIADEAWTPNRKKILEQSRVNATALLFEKIRNSSDKIESYTGASAIGIYGESNYFEKNLCTLWEEQHNHFEGYGIRTVVLRIGLVQSLKGGMLQKFLIPLKFLVAPVFGKGNQMLSWIHIDDLCRLILFSIENKSVNGTFDAVAPAVCTFNQYTSALKIAGNRRSVIIHIPAFILKMIFGKRVQMLLDGNKVLPEKITAAGFTFLFPEINNALKNLFRK